VRQKKEKKSERTNEHQRRSRFMTIPASRVLGLSRPQGSRDFMTQSAFIVDGSRSAARDQGDADRKNRTQSRKRDLRATSRQRRTIVRVNL